MKRLLLVATMLMVALLSAGCKMSINMETTVLPSTEMDQSVIITYEGLPEEAMQNVKSEETALAENGWTQEVTTEGDTVVMRATRHLQYGDDLFPPTEGGADSPKPRYDLQVVDTPEYREYSLSILMQSDESAASPTSAETAVDPEMAEFGAEIAEMMTDMMEFSWTINMPGEVVDTNADVRTENGGTWVFGQDQAKDRELKMVSRERKQ
ncbi:MAG TPA: hypothetical protein VHS06_00965 [Chloroflexota bacterium]|nr:hypothetical protein [Chloroflexota bacterium]